MYLYQHACIICVVSSGFIHTMWHTLICIQCKCGYIQVLKNSQFAHFGNNYNNCNVKHLFNRSATRNLNISVIVLITTKPNSIHCDVVWPMLVVARLASKPVCIHDSLMPMLLHHKFFFVQKLTVPIKSDSPPSNLSFPYLCYSIY